MMLSPAARDDPPRVAFVAPFGLRQKTTIWARTLPLARALTAQGWEATIFIPPWDSPADAGKQWEEAGVTLVNVPLGGGTPAIAARLLRAIDRFAPQIVYVVKPRAHAGIVQWLCWQRRRLPGSRRTHLLLDIDDWEQAWAPINHYPPHVARFLAWQEEWGIRHCDGITAASRWLETRAHSYAPQTPVLYLPNGVLPPPGDHRAWEPPQTSDVLFFTRFVEVTPAWLAAFWRSLYALQPAARLLIAGGPVQPGLERRYQTAMAQIGTAATAVDWLGLVPRETLPALYGRTRCAIFPADAVPLQEAKCSVRLATTLLEGVPVVASAVGEQANYGADGAACLVPAGSAPEIFAGVVAQVLADPQAQVALGAAARHRLVQRYDWRRLGGELADHYAKIMGEARRVDDKTQG
jgi:glycosyltransferase involved in cell wall biosynthesis